MILDSSGTMVIQFKKIVHVVKKKLWLLSGLYNTGRTVHQLLHRPGDNDKT